MTAINAISPIVNDIRSVSATVTRTFIGTRARIATNTNALFGSHHAATSSPAVRIAISPMVTAAALTSGESCSPRRMAAR